MKHQKLRRALIGLGVLTLVIVIGFWLALTAIPNWGARPIDVTRALPGDALLSNPAVRWTHVINLNAPADQVYPWLAQIGERRGGYYTFTFIENQLGNGDVYHNADRIVPEWQNPQPGDVLIANSLQVSAVEPGKWILAESTNEMGWTWLWYVEPIDETHSRLIVRNHIQPVGEIDNPMIGTVITLGGFVMEQGMLRGIRDRVEGVSPPAPIEGVEIALWLAAFVACVIAALFTVTARDWKLALLIGVLGVISLFVFTFVQPDIWTRALAVLGLYVGLVFVWSDRLSPSPSARPLRPAYARKS